MANKILVIGGTGLVGLRLCQRLAQSDYHVTCAARNYRIELDALNISFLSVDLLDLSGVDLSGFDYIFYCAGTSVEWQDREVILRRNLHALQEVTLAAKKASVKGLIFSSCSLAQFDQGPVGSSLKAAESFLLEQNDEGLKTLIIRSQWVWGSNDSHFLQGFLTKAKEGIYYHPYSLQVKTDVIHVDNYVFAHELALEKLIQGQDVTGKAYFVAQERALELVTFHEQLLQYAQIDCELVEYSFKALRAFCSEWFYRILGIRTPAPAITRSQIRHWGVDRVFSQDLAIERLGYYPRVKIEEGMEELFEEKKRRLRLISELEEQGALKG